MKSLVNSNNINFNLFLNTCRIRHTMAMQMYHTLQILYINMHSTLDSCLTEFIYLHFFIYSCSCLVFVFVCFFLSFFFKEIHVHIFVNRHCFYFLQWYLLSIVYIKELLWLSLICLFYHC